MDTKEIILLIDKYGNEDFMVIDEKNFSYSDLLSHIKYFEKELNKYNLAQNSVIIISGVLDISFLALMITLLNMSMIIIPISALNDESIINKYIDISKPNLFIKILESQKIKVDNISQTRDTQLQSKYDMLKTQPGLVLFTSGSSGEPKAVLHNFHTLLRRYKVVGKKLTTYSFLLFDHIGGLNTIFYTIRNGGTLVYCSSKLVHQILETIVENKVELLPTTPSFLNLVRISNLVSLLQSSSLKLITYGTEPMPLSLLDFYSSTLKGIKLKQTYGSTEVGILSTFTESSQSIWMKASPEQGIRVIDGELQVKTQTPMVTYLNSESPFTEDGWYKTGDQIIEKGEYFQIIGRINDTINVGGLKANPVEIENALMEIEIIEDCRVYSEPNSIIGNIVVADVKINAGVYISEEEAKRNIREFCLTRLEKYKIPVKINFVKEIKINSRFKKIRKKDVD